MYLDKQAQFEENNLITTSRVSTNTIDLGRAAQDVGRGEPITIMVQVTTTFTAGGAATLHIGVITDDDPALGSPTVVQDTPAPIAVATLVAGYRYMFEVLPTDLLRYVGLTFTVATGPMTAGALTAGIVETRQKEKLFPGNFVTA